MESHTNSVLCLVVSNRLIYTGSSDGTAKCWVTEFGDCTKTYKGHKHSVICLRFYHGLRKHH
jgi:WD40 repeat protein